MCVTPSQEWHLQHGDFLSGVSPVHSISMMNQMCKLLINALKDYHTKSDIRCALVEGMKFCVAWFLFKQFGTLWLSSLVSKHRFTQLYKSHEML